MYFDWLLGIASGYYQLKCVGAMARSLNPATESNGTLFYRGLPIILVWLS